MVKFSIIVPVYKVEYTKLKKCIESLIKQTYTNYEIIIVDDGSPDDCPKICDEFAEKNSKVVVVHQKNKGLSGARNTGVRKSKGEWYTFVDGDDFIDENTLERLENEITDDVDLICTRLLPASKKEDIGNYPYENKKVYSTNEELYYLKKMLLNFNGNNNSSCGKLYSKKFTDKYEIFHNESLKQGAEDLEFNFRIFSKAKKIKILTNGFYHCVYNENSITRSFNEENEELKLKCFKTIRTYINDQDTELIEMYNCRLLYMIVNSAISGYFNPSSNYNYSTKKQKFEKFIKDEDLQNAMRNINPKEIDKKRLFIIKMIKLKLYFIINFLAKIRYNQKRI